MYLNKDKMTLWDINQKILAACAFRKLPEDESWLDNFKFLSFSNKQSDDASLIHFEQSSLQRASFDLIEYAMDCLAHYAMKFNQCRVLGLKVNITNPALVSEHSSDSMPKPSQLHASYRGRLTAKDWTLVVRTNSHLVEFLLVPVSKVLNMSHFAREIEPLITLKPELENRHIRWRHNNETYTPSEMGSLFQNAFKQLIEKVYSEMNRDDLLQNPEHGSRKANGFLGSEPGHINESETEDIGRDEMAGPGDKPGETAEPLEFGTDFEGEAEVDPYYDEIMDLAEQELKICQELIESFCPEQPANSTEIDEVDVTIYRPETDVFPSHQEFLTKEVLQEESEEESLDYNSSREGDFLMQVQEQIKICISKLLRQEENIQAGIVCNGVRAFESSDLEKVETLLHQANSQKKRIEQLQTLLDDWSDLSKVDLLLEAATENEFTFDVLSINPEDSSSVQVQRALDSLLNVLLQIGSQAFTEIKLDIVQSAYKRVLELQSFQRKFEELSGSKRSETVRIDPVKRLTTAA